MGKWAPLYYNFKQLRFLVATKGERLTILISALVHPSLHHAKQICWILLHNFLPEFCLSVTHQGVNWNNCLGHICRSMYLLQLHRHLSQNRHTAMKWLAQNGAVVWWKVTCFIQNHILHILIQLCFKKRFRDWSTLQIIFAGVNEPRHRGNQ